MRIRAELTVVGQQQAGLRITFGCFGVGLDATVCRCVRRSFSASPSASTAPLVRLDGRLSSASLAVELAIAREIAETNQGFVREGQDARAKAVPFGFLRDMIGDRMALGRARVVRRQERGRDDPDRAEFGRLFRVKPTREPTAERAPELFLFAEELAEAVDEFSSRDGADCGGQDVAAVADLVPVPVLIFVPFRSCCDLLVQLGEASSVRSDESMGSVEPEQVEGIEAASRRGERQRSRGRGARAEDVGPRSLVRPAIARRGKDDSQVCFAQAGDEGHQQQSNTWRKIARREGSGQRRTTLAGIQGRDPRVLCASGAT